MRRGILSWPMTAVVQARRFRDVPGMSGLPQTADISGPARHFAFVPGADMIFRWIDRRARAPNKES